MAISGIGGFDPTSLITQAGSTLARSNSLNYNNTDLASTIAALSGGNSADPFAVSQTGTDGIGADGLGLSAAELGLARKSGASAEAAARLGRVDAGSSAKGGSFEDALLKAIDGVNADQQKTSNLIQQMVVAPDTVNAHDVTIAMAEANLSLNLAKTILNRIVSGWKEVINTR